MKLLPLILAALLLAGCTANTAPVQHGIQGAANANAGLTADLEATGKGIEAAKPHADPVGQAHLEEAGGSNDAAKLKAVATAKALDEATKRDDAFAAQLAKLKSENGSLLHSVTGWASVVGLLIFAAGVSTFCSGIPVAKYVAIGGIVLATTGAALSVAVTAIALVLPWILGGVGVVIVGGIAYAFVKHKGSLAEVVSDIKPMTGHLQPTVPYSPATKALVETVAGPAAANPDPVAAATITIDGLGPVGKAA